MVGGTSFPPRDSKSGPWSNEQKTKATPKPSTKGKAKPEARCLEGSGFTTRPLEVSLDNADTVIEGGPPYREAKGGALRPGRVAERWDKFPASRLVAVQCDSISTPPSSPGLSQTQRTGLSALHKPILRTLHQS